MTSENQQYCYSVTRNAIIGGLLSEGRQRIE